MGIGNYTFGGMLTELVKITTYAVCHNCKKVYQDDAPQYGSLMCPICRNAVERGVTKENARNMLDDNHKELLS